MDREKKDIVVVQECFCTVNFVYKCKKHNFCVKHLKIEKNYAFNFTFQEIIMGFLMEIVAQCLVTKLFLNDVECSIYGDFFPYSKMDKNKSGSGIHIYLESITKSLAGVMIQED